MLFENVPILPKIFPSKTLDAVTLDSLSHLARNRNAEATAVKIVYAAISYKMPVLKPLPLL